MITMLDPDQGQSPYSANLIGPRLQALPDYCKISFWLYMDGDRSWIDLTYRTDTSFTQLYFLEDSPGKFWTNHVVEVGKQDANGFFELEAKPTYFNDLDYYDIAIDDVKYIDCKPDSVVVDKSLDCDFEIDFCGYVHDTSGDVQWRLKANGSHSTGSPSGPLFDHTTGLGYYAQFKSYSFYSNRTGKFTTDQLSSFF